MLNWEDCRRPTTYLSTMRAQVSMEWVLKLFSVWLAAEVLLSAHSSSLEDRRYITADDGYSTPATVDELIFSQKEEDAQIPMEGVFTRGSPDDNQTRSDNQIGTPHTVCDVNGTEITNFAAFLEWITAQLSLPVGENEFPGSPEYSFIKHQTSYALSQEDLLNSTDALKEHAVFDLFLWEDVVLKITQHMESFSNLKNCTQLYQVSRFQIDFCEMSLRETAELLSTWFDTRNLTMSTNNTLMRNPNSFCFTTMTYAEKLADYITTLVKLLRTDRVRNHVGMSAIIKMEAEDGLEHFIMLLDHLNRTSPLLIDSDLDSKLRAFEKQVNYTITHINLGDMQTESTAEWSISKCVSYIRNGEPGLAYKEYRKLNDSSLLGNITRESYDGNPENVGKIISFVNYLESPDQQRTVYTLLFDEMTNCGHLWSPEILKLYDVTGNGGYALSTLHTKLKPLVSNLISAWGHRVRAGDTYQFTEFERRNEYTMNNHLGNLVSSSYANNMTNFESVLNFVNGLEHTKSWITGYDALLEEMRKNKNQLYSAETIRLAYTVAHFETKTVESNDDLDGWIGLHYRILKYKFPSNVIDLIWIKSNCTIRNDRHLEYMCTSYYHHQSDSGCRKLFTATDGLSNSQCAWDFTTADGGKTFSVKSVAYNEYLMSDKNHMPVCIRGNPHDQGNWVLTPVDKYAFTIQNVSGKEKVYLLADGNVGAGNDNGRKRSLFGSDGTPQGTQWDESKWVISCRYSRA